MSRVVDLSLPTSPRSPRSVDHPEVRFKQIRTFLKNGSQTHTAHMSLHAGTHVDAPALYFKDGACIDQLPIDRFIGPGVIIDAAREDWGVISAGDLEGAPVSIEPGDIVYLHTGWSRFYFADQERYYLKTPGLDRSAVDWLVQKRVNIVIGEGPAAEHFFMHADRWRGLRPDIVGSVDFAPDEFPRAYFHRELLRHDILIVDHAGGDVSTILNRRCTIGVMPAKYEAVEAAPARVFALVD